MRKPEWCNPTRTLHIRIAGGMVPLAREKHTFSAPLDGSLRPPYSPLTGQRGAMRTAQLEQLGDSLKRAAILDDFERLVTLALVAGDDRHLELLAERYLREHPWLAGDVYRKVYLRGRRRATESRAKTLDRLLASYNPRTVRYLSEGWRRQRDEATAELRELEAAATLDPPTWPQVVGLLRAQLHDSRQSNDSAHE